MDSTIVGRPIGERDAPALLVDLDAMERDIAAIAAARRRHGVIRRPHAKVRTCPTFAHKQPAAGAIGVIGRSPSSSPCGSPPSLPSAWSSSAGGT
jgi:D-serine deaminase-like pyridoxal phosphate-dependent protein